MIRLAHPAVPGITQEQKLEQWIRQYGTAILRTCFVYLSDAAQAEDAMQDTFLKAWNSMEKFDDRGDGAAKKWLMRIAINTCRDYRRSRWFRYVDRSKTLDDLPAPMEAMSAQERSLLIDIMHLPEKYKRVLLLYYYQEMTLQETADVLGISRSTVHSRLQKAQLLLKRILTGREIR